MSSAPPAFPRLRLDPDVDWRQLLVLFGDQLDPRHLEAADFDPRRDAVLLMEVAQEATHVPSHKARTAVFLASMRHFARQLADDGTAVHYVCLDDEESSGSFGGEIVRLCGQLEPESLVAVRPGEWRVLHALEAAAETSGRPLRMVENGHFYCTPGEFADWAAGRKSLIMEYFYRTMRRREGLLLDAEGEPEGGQWNYDEKNRKPLGADAPAPPPVPRFEPDAITAEVLTLVEEQFPDAPGRLDSFAWPVTREQARAALADFVEHRLPHFGRYQDAMKAGEPWLFHSLLSPALNLGLLDPREAVGAAIERYRDGSAPLPAVEGFVRQVLGWREFVRGVYWHEGPAYAERNGLDEQGELPEMYWTGETDMACLRDSLGQVLEHAYGHHIQRLMVTGNFALLAGVHPKAISDWYLGMYVDGIDWVTLPNTLGMVMHADGGVVGTKPYAASGRYLERMSDYCAACPYDPGQRHGEDACPFTTLYWHFLERHRERLAGNRRMGFAWANLDRLGEEERSAIDRQARKLRRRLVGVEGGVEEEGESEDA